MKEYIYSADGLKLYTKFHRCQTPEASVIFVHGYTEHSGRYEWLAKELNNQQIDFLTYDQRGFGRSEGLRAYITKFEQYIDDLAQFIKKLETNTSPVFLMGQSMGSLIAVHYLLKHKDSSVKGLISTSGALKISEHISPFLRKISGILSFIAPKSATIKLDASALSRDPEVVRDYIEDPLVYHGGAKSRLGYEMLMAMKTVQQNASQFFHPILLMHGTADRLADVKGSEMFYQNCNSEDKKLLLYEGWYHELLREPDRDIIVHDITQWIKNRL